MKCAWDQSGFRVQVGSCGGGTSTLTLEEEGYRAREGAEREVGLHGEKCSLKELCGGIYLNAYRKGGDLIHTP